VKAILPFNRVGTPAWWLNGKVLRRRHFGLVQIAVLNFLTPLFRRIDRALPFPPLSLVAILENAAATAGSRPDPSATADSRPAARSAPSA
jgi:hypothetical protein